MAEGETLDDPITGSPQTLATDAAFFQQRSAALMASWRPMLPLLFVAALIAVEDFLSAPSCSISGRDAGGAPHPDDLKVMVVADLLLLGSDAGYADLFFRHPYTARFFKKSYERLNPDMLIVLGDISAGGSEMTERKWLSVLQQFHAILGPFAAIPYHVVLGDRDIGECDKLDADFVDEIATGLPGLDGYGCSSFVISNVSFATVNSVAMLCSENGVRFGVEKLIERESVNLRTPMTEVSEEPVETKEDFSNFRWRANYAPSGSGPVVLLHFPLNWVESTSSGGDGIPDVRHYPCGGSKSLGDRGIIGAGPYEWSCTLSSNVTDYIFQSLKPRMVFSAHTHLFCDYTHGDGIREVTVPAMSWVTHGDPGFILVTFKQGDVVVVSHCSLASESLVLVTYFFMFVLLMVTTVLMKWSYLIHFTGF